MPAKPMELIFPLKGVDDGWGFGNQPEGTTPDALNVVPVDTLDSRIRGGQRWGTTKYFDALHNGANAIQRMTTIAAASDMGDIIKSTVAVSGSDWTEYEDAPAYFAPIFILDGVKTPIGKEYHIKLTIQAPAVTEEYHFGFLLRVNSSHNDEFYAITIRLGMTTGFDYADLLVYLTKSDGEGSTLISSASTGGDSTFYPLVLAGTEIDFIIGADGSIDMTRTEMDPLWDIELVPGMTLYENNTEFGVGFSEEWEGEGAIDYSDFELTGLDPPTSGRTHKIVSVSGGDVYVGKATGSSLSLATSGTNALTTSGRMDIQTVFGKVYFADGNPDNYKYLDSDNDTVYTWTPTDGTLPMGTDQTAIDITAATPGTPSFTVAEDWSGRTAGDYLLVAGSTANNGFYTIASITGSGPTIITVNETVTDNTVDGTIQYQNKACTIIKLYRGRIVMSGLLTDPQNWFMSAADNPLDFDYGATPSETMAVAGNNTNAGYCPDIITCLAPYSDDLMFIGGDHTLWLMRGDPASRGRIDNISYRTGISGPDAFAFDPNGIFYFFGQGTLWRMSAGGVPEPLSRNRMDVAFGAIDLTVSTVHLVWDNIRHGLHIFIVLTASGSTVHYYWDERTDGFWPISFPNDQGPTAILAFDGDSPTDSALLLGGWDGYIRYIDPSVKNDDTVAISSHVLYSPIMAGGLLRNMRINGLTAIMDTNSDDVTLTVYAEDTPQGVVESATSDEAAVNITGVSQVNKTFTVAEDWSSRLAGDRLLIAGSTGNDGFYTLASLTGAGPTVLTVIGTISSAVVDGTIQYKDRVRYARVLSAGRNRVLNRVAGNAIMFKLANSTVSETWAIENIIADVEVIGRTRKHQL